MAAPLSDASRVARALYVYVAGICGLLSLALPWSDLDPAEQVALARLILFAVGGVAGWTGITYGQRWLQYLAAGVGIVALYELLSRFPTLLTQYDVAVANAGWFAFLGANSVFVALIVAGYLSVTGQRRSGAAETRSAA